MFLFRKITEYLINWKNDKHHKPLIVKGARQVGKTMAIRDFGAKNYESFIEINFILQKEYRDIFENGYEVDRIIKNISFRDTSLNIIPGKTLIFFDEIQECVNAATSLKSFNEDGRFDVICSGSLMGINYKEIESNSVGNKQDKTMYPLDFEEFLINSGYTSGHLQDIKEHMINVEPFSETVLNVLFEKFSEYMVLGGMPAVVSRFIEEGNFTGTLEIQRQIIADYEEDITKYAEGLDKTKVLQVFRAIPVFLGKGNKKFQITKIAKNARNREYIGVTDWLKSAGIVNVCYCMMQPELPLKGNFDYYNYKLYMGDTGLLVASLDDEAQSDLRDNRNFNTYKGAIYENVIAQMLGVQGYETLFYRSKKGDIEMDFMVRDRKHLIPVEVKANDGATKSLNNMISDERYSDISYGIKFCKKNIGNNGTFYTFPYFSACFLRTFLDR